MLTDSKVLLTDIIDFNEKSVKFANGKIFDF